MHRIRKDQCYLGGELLARGNNWSGTVTDYGNFTDFQLCKTMD